MQQSLVDQNARDLFIESTECNFSVIAPAGVGKTTAIVSRIAQIALRDHSRIDPLLSKLVVVTYTNKAASEMQERARQCLLSQSLSPDRFSAFNQAFFGTIHSFCMDLLKKYGFVIGLPGQFSLAGDEHALWLGYVRSQDSLLHNLPVDARSAFARFGSIKKVMQLASSLTCRDFKVPPLGNCPEIDISPILRFEPESKRGLNGILVGKHIARAWRDGLERGETVLPLPEYNNGGAAFQEVWQSTFQPLRDWLGQASLVLAKGIANDFQAFRIAQGQLRYDDMIHLARRLVYDSVAGSLIRSNGYRVILDEAQDTDQDQFDVLLGIAGEPNARLGLRGFWLPEPGRFSMVGDPQQSIFSSRADLAAYLQVHQMLSGAGGGQALTFQVTMRCDQSVVDTVNAFFPNVLQKYSGPARQVDYVPLCARPDAGLGVVQKIKMLPPEHMNSKAGVKERAICEAQAFAEWFAQQSETTLGVEDWSQVAILSPRNEWLALLARALRDKGVPLQVHSHRETLGDDPVYGWFTALLHVFAHPDDAFEITGILRELFGLSDHSIAHFVRKSRSLSTLLHPLNLTDPKLSQGDVEGALNQLREVRLMAIDKPLREAVGIAVESLYLKDRLLSLGALDATMINASLNHLLMKATLAEEKGTSLVDWVKTLRQAFDDRLEPSPPLAGRLQLFSCHKAKGLEWQTVIVPFFFKPITSRNESYPRLISLGSDTIPVVAYDKYCQVEARQWVQKNAFFEHQRLCYVTATRAARRCYFVDDEQFYQNHQGSFADCMHCADTGKNRLVWEALPPFSVVEKMDTSSRTQPSSSSDTLHVDRDAIANPDACLAKSVARSQTFTRRIIPSSLAIHTRMDEAREVLPEPCFPEVSAQFAGKDGVDYGNWWHGVMEHAPWEEGKAAWGVYFTEQFQQCPQIERGKMELAQFMSSDAAHLLDQFRAGIRTEVPFLFQQAACAYDGFIDLIAYQAAQGAWVVIDWKTDQVDRTVDELVARYAQQILAYIDAMKTVFKQPVTGYLYSTRLGQWARVK